MSIFDRKRFGLVIRGFAKEPGLVEGTVAQIVKTVEKAAPLRLAGKAVYHKILVLVPRDEAYPDCDCGETADRARIALASYENAIVHEVMHGDLFCGVLNYGIAKLLRAGCDYVTILSHGAADYLASEEIENMGRAFEAGAKVHGIAIAELSQSILDGRIANTFATWDTAALVQIGGFDLRAAQPRADDKTAAYLRGWNAEKGEVFYPRAGVEEIIPLIRLVETFGPCIAPTVPVGAPAWKTPDPATDPEGYARHLKKMGTKFERQAAHAAAMNADLSFIKGGVMPQYRVG